MTEENKQEKEPTEIPKGLARASESGWRPQEEWQGDPDAWVDWKEFNFRGELMGRINEQSGILHNYKGQIEEQKKTIADLAELQGKIAEREYSKALRTLRLEKVQAIEAGDGAKVVELDEEIDELREKKVEAKAAPVEKLPVDDSVPPEVVAWLAKPDNQWYHQDMFLKSVADGYAKTIKSNNDSISPAALLAQVDSAMRKELPHRFKSTNSVVDSGGDLNHRERSNGRKPTFGDLDDIQQEVCRRYEKQGVMSKAEYIESLVAAGDL